MSWSTSDVLKLVEVLKKHEVVWRWKMYQDRNFYKIVDVVTEISEVVRKTNKEVLNQIEMLWKLILHEFIAYNSLTKDPNHVEWKHKSDFAFLFRDINDALQIWRKIYPDIVRYPLLFEETYKDVKGRTSLITKIIKEGNFNTNYSGVLKPSHLILLITNFKYSNCNRPFLKMHHFDINCFPKLFHTPNKPRFQLPSFYLNLWDVPDEHKRKTHISSLDDIVVEDYDPEIHPDLAEIEINGLLANIPIVDNQRDVFDNDNIFQLLYLYLSFLAVKHDIYNFLDDSVEAKNIWKEVAESFEVAGYPFKAEELINIWKYILHRARDNAKKFREDPDKYPLSNLDLEINYSFPISVTDIKNNKMEEKVDVPKKVNYEATTSSVSNVTPINKVSETFTNDSNETLNPPNVTSTITGKGVIDLTDNDKLDEEEAHVIEDSSDEDCKILINLN